MYLKSSCHYLINYRSVLFILSLVFCLFPNYVLADQKNGPSITIENKEAEPGEVVNVEVTGKGLENIGAFDCWISFNDSVLSFIDLENIHTKISGLSYNVINDSIVALSWSNTSGVDIEDGEMLFELQLGFCNDLYTCALNETMSSLNFVEGQTHFTTIDFEELPLTYNNGSVYSPVPLRILTIEVEGSGDVAVDGVPYQDPVVEFENTLLTLEASAEEGYSFVNWTDAQQQEVSTEQEYSFSMPANDLKLTANFQAIPVTHKVTFSVSMEYVTQDYAGFDFDHDNDVVYIAGDFYNGWAEPGEDPDNQKMHPDQDDPMIYSITLDLEQGSYEYKFFLNEGTEGAEWDNEQNREVIVDDDMKVMTWFGSSDDPTGIPHLSSRNISLTAYPVPAREHLTIESNTRIDEIQLINLMGQVLLSQKVQNNHFIMDVSAFEQGSYFIIAITAQGKRTIQIKIVN